MATKIIPLDSTYDHFTQSVELDGVVYGMEFKYNARDQRWFFDLTDSQGNLLLGSIPVMLGWPLLKQFTWNLSVPPGVMYFLDQSGTDVEPGRFELGQRVVMVYEAVSA